MAERRNENNPSRKVADLKAALDVYVAGHSGIRFDALIRFAGPLFDLYDIDWRASHEEAASRDKEELTTMVAVLDTARLLWAFFSLDDQDSLAALPDLEDVLLGRAAGDEERSNLLVLLSLLEEHWRSFTPGERAAATDVPGYALPSFDTLLAHFEGRTAPLPRRARETFGPDDLEMPEAMAVFAQPLVDDPSVRENPDLVEQRFERAQAYWDLATTPDEEYGEQLRYIEETFAETEDERSRIRSEAEEMVARFRRLFSDRSGTT